MENNKEQEFFLSDINYDNLRADCSKCFGFCCVALFFSASEGFPIDKVAGIPCINLNSDFQCSVHNKLGDLGYKGCMSYDCFGAGQKVAQVSYSGNDWRKSPKSAAEMYEVFLIMRQIHEMLWYLTESLLLESDLHAQEEIKSMLKKTEELTFLEPISLLKLDLSELGSAVNELTLKVSQMARSKVLSQKVRPKLKQKTFGRGLDLMGKNLCKIDLKGEDLRGSYLIAAKLIGADLYRTDLMFADMRDADIRGADLTHSLFATQAQINSAIGDSHTKLPEALTPPIYW